MAPETGSFTDPRDGKVYTTVRIAEKWIMAENLAYKPVQGNYWVYNNDTNNISLYGYLYDWETAKKVAPEGWHLPSRKEWTVLNKSLGLNKVTLNKDSERNTTNFEKLLPGGISGFNAVFGGNCLYNGNLFIQIDTIGKFWSSTGSADGPYLFYVARPNSEFHNKTGITGIRNHNHPLAGESVRLIQDQMLLSAKSH